MNTSSESSELEFNLLPPPVQSEVQKIDAPGLDDIEVRFTYHAPNESQVERLKLIRENAKKLAYIIKYNSKPSREQSLALTKLEESVMWANAGIVRNE